MRNHSKYAVKIVVAAQLFLSGQWAHAGSYEDFFRAVIRDDGGEIQALLQRGFDPNTPDPKGFEGLFIAVREQSRKAAAVLAAWPGTHVDDRTVDDETPLMMACLKGDLEMARQLIARGADVNKTGWTPLHYAATNGHLPLIALLLEQSAYIDAESPNGTTPLMMAAQYGSPESVRFLLEQGADPTLKNQLGLTAQDFAMKGSRPDAIRMLGAASGEWASRQVRKAPGTW